jgi:segregation and condensation protein A
LIEEQQLKISLPLYEGPLDLLLDMIRRQKLDIYDIPIAQITRQYLDYLHLLQEMNVDLASEFMLMAAQLIYIKSRTLLPPDPDGLDEEAEDPRAELVRRLLEYEKFKNAAQMLYQKEMVEKVSWNNAGAVPFEDSELEPQVSVGLYDLLLAFRDVIKRAESRPSMQVDREEFSIEQMMGYLFDRIVSSKHVVTLTEILPAINSKRGLIVAFLALLELTRLKAIFLTQDKPLGEISATANPDYELSQSFRPA